jgi:predicted  nucleic acid-binding Zn-ribbon protein
MGSGGSSDPEVQARNERLRQMQGSISKQQKYIQSLRKRLDTLEGQSRQTALEDEVSALERGNRALERQARALTQLNAAQRTELDQLASK